MHEFWDSMLSSPAPYFSEPQNSSLAGSCPASLSNKAKGARESGNFGHISCTVPVGIRIRDGRHRYRENMEINDSPIQPKEVRPWIIERGERDRKREILTLTLRVPVKLIIFMTHAHAIGYAAAARAALHTHGTNWF